MFKRSNLSTSIAIAVALAAQPLAAQEQEQQQFAALEEVVVTGIRASLDQALDIKRESMQIVDAIVAEDIGKFPDNNVVEALQRISGVQVTDRGAGEVSTVSIRGLNDVTTTINGRNIFTASGRSVALADIPASLLARVDVFKTRSADLIETGIAGQINIHTQRPFDFDGSKFVLAARGIYQEQADSTDPNVSALASNRWDTGIGEIGALVNVSYAETNYRDQNITAGAVLPFMTADAPAGWAPFERIFPGDARGTTDPLNNPIWQAGLDAGLPFAPGSSLDLHGEPAEYVLSRDAIFQNDFTGTRERPAANVALQWAPNDSSEYIFEAFYNGYRNESFNSLVFAFADAWWALGDNPADTVTLYEGTNIVKERTVGDTGGFTSGDLLTGKTDSYVYALGGQWDITDNFSLESEIVHQTSEYDEDFFAMRGNKVPNFYQLSVDFNSGGGLPAFGFADNPATADLDESDLTDPAHWAMGDLYDNALQRKGDAFTFTADGEYSFDSGFLRKASFGVRHDDRNASEAQRTGGSAPCNTVDGEQVCLTSTLGDYPGLLSSNSGFFDGESDVPTSWVVPNGYYIRDNADMIRTIYNDEINAGLTLSNGLSLAETFDVNEATTAVYAQTTFETEVAGRILDGQVGLRYVSVDTDMAFTDLNSSETGTATASTSKLLPSLMVRYGITDDLLARFSYGETLRRPDFVQLNPMINYVRDTTGIGYGTASGGNPGLEPTESKNYDVSLEWYFADASSVYATVFKREIEGLVTNYVNTVTFDDGDGSYPYQLSQPDNASNGELDGVELGFIYFPANLPSVLDGFGVQASYTILDSSQDVPVQNAQGEVTDIETTPMFGVSDSSYSVVLAYEKEKFDARLSYVWRDDFLNNLEAASFANPRGVYRKAETSMDLQLSYDVTDELMVTFDATNLTNEIYQSYYEHADVYNFGSSLYSRTFALGARYSF